MKFATQRQLLHSVCSSGNRPDWFTLWEENERPRSILMRRRPKDLQLVDRSERLLIKKRDRKDPALQIFSKHRTFLPPNSEIPSWCGRHLAGRHIYSPFQSKRRIFHPLCLVLSHCHGGAVTPLLWNKLYRTVRYWSSCHEAAEVKRRTFHLCEVISTKGFTEINQITGNLTIIVF